DRPRKGALYHLLRCALLNNGIDCSANHGWISAVHTDEDLERTVQGYERALRAMAADGAFKGLGGCGCDAAPERRWPCCSPAACTTRPSWTPAACASAPRTVAPCARATAPSSAATSRAPA